MCVWICNDQKETVRLSTACSHHWPSVFVLTRWGQNEKSATTLHHNNIRRCLTEVVRLCDPHNAHRLTFWILFNAICSLYHSTVWSSSETVGLYSLDENAAVFLLGVTSYVCNNTKTQIWTFTPLIERQSPIWEILTPLTSLTVFSAVLNSRKVISRYNANYCR